ncbi:MAG: type II secretion system F family protein [Anaerolineae bacterium]|jgi:tight adherence protein B|uniref:type II secretion system F family protein n=1 Tax=Candidatus Flexifilum breve TaxID=3140694 RepID=UPI001ACA1779|nr:type II secretion system F family protein [Chloroflexota bacterium]MBK9750681.1 type II secretion system F family protein [Chloroflexota bacterium]MBN8635056.1 type II secretion system F family protein [Anaerolineae bacterium]
MQIDPIIVIVVAVLLAGGVIVWGIVSVRTEKDIIEERLSNYEKEATSFLDLEELKDEPQVQEKRPSIIQERLDSLVSERSFGKKWRQQLARADIKLTVSEYAAVHVFSMFAFFAIGYFVVFGQQIVMAILAGFVGFFAPRIYVSRLTSTRLIRFENQLPDTLGLWVNALRSGYSVLQSMEAIARDAPEPTATEFKRVVQEVQLGIDMDDALEHLVNRVESEDLDLVVTAVNIQREVGGNLAEILDVISHTIRERIKLKGEIRVLTAQGRATGYLISFLPIVLALFLYGINPGYMGNLFENRTCGWPMLGIGLALIGIGFAVVQKIVDIDI